MPVCFLNSAITGCIGTRYGDQIIPLTSAAPAALAAATVRSSMDAARASGMVPGMRFATVNPTPPSMKLRREIFDLVMASSLRYFLLDVRNGPCLRPRLRLASPPRKILVVG